MTRRRIDVMLSPALPAELVRRIDLSISELKRSGELQQLQHEALASSQPAQI